MNYPTSFGDSAPRVLPKVEAAFRYLDYYSRLLEGPPNFHAMPGDCPKESGGRKPTDHERRVYDAALSTLLEYFNTEDFGEAPVQHGQVDGGDDDPKEREPVEVQ